jgi:hypothetical protein
MSTDRDVTRIVRSWLEEGATALPDRVLDNVLDRLPATHQRRPLWPVRKVGAMNTPIRTAIAAAAVLVVAVLGLNFIPRQGGVGGPTLTASPSPTPSPASTPSPSAVPSPSGTRGALNQLDTPTTLKPGTYRVADPFTVPFSITFSSKWTAQTLAQHDATFAEVDPADPGRWAAWIKVNLADNVYTDPCNAGGGPAKLAVPTTVDGTVTAITHMKGFAHGAVTDVVVAGHAGKHFVLMNSIDTTLCTYGGLIPLWTWNDGTMTGAGTNSDAVDEIWVIDVGGKPVIIDGEVFGDYFALSYPKELQTIVSTMTFGP